MPETSPLPRPGIKFNRLVSRRQVLDAVIRMRPVHEGQPYLVRFSIRERLEHIVLTVTVIFLALTGMMQTFDNHAFIQQLIRILGGLEVVQQIHHLFALILLAAAIYHAFDIADGIFVRRENPKILPGMDDLRHLLQVVSMNLGLSSKQPLFDRYSFDEKFYYWVTVIEIGLLSITGLGMMFPALSSQVLPGVFFPYAVIIHRWQAFFLITATLLLHTYQVLLRKKNFSVFSGKMAIQDMVEDHPVELAYLEKAASLAGERTLPKEVVFYIEERFVQREVKKGIEKSSKSESGKPEIGMHKATEVKPEVVQTSDQKPLESVLPTDEYENSNIPAIEKR